MLSRLNVHHFRNLTDVQITPHAKFNIFCGDNGSGKTSLLEAIYHLLLGRSFRTHIPQHLIQHKADHLAIFGEVDSIPIGVTRHRSGQFEIRLKQKTIHALSELVSILPVQLIDYSICSLLMGGPSERRQFMDWGMFHVKHHEFLDSWKQFRRLLKQRNSALKQSAVSRQQLSVWHEHFTETANQINEMRIDYLDRFRRVFEVVRQQLLPQFDIGFDFSPGWDTQYALGDLLGEQFAKDVVKGHTCLGPQRADLHFYVDQHPIASVLSRGQLKLLACVLRLSQVITLKQETGKNSLLLIDDLVSELDEQRSEMICQFLSELGMQVFLTHTQVGYFKRFWGGDTNLVEFQINNGGLVGR